MDYFVADIQRLLEDLKHKTKKSLTHGGFQQMYEMMEKEKGHLPFSEDYLYRKIFLGLKKASDRKSKLLSLNAHNIEAIAAYLGYTGYAQFLLVPEQLLHSGLENCLGNWYSYVRCNSGNPDVLVSPVRIFAEGKEIYMELKGPVRRFRGRMSLKGNCLHCLLESENEKNIHLVFKIGFSQKPDVLQGVFSGLSSGGDPIAGREVLVRQAQAFDALLNRKISIAALLESAVEEERRIGAYFEEIQGAIVTIRRSSTFSLSDLA